MISPYPSASGSTSTWGASRMEKRKKLVVTRPQRHHQAVFKLILLWNRTSAIPDASGNDIPETAEEECQMDTNGDER